MSGLFAGTPLERPVTCQRCQQPHAQCACPRGRDGKVLDPKVQNVRIRREHRRGKVTTVVAGLAPRSDKSNDLPDILSKLKKKLGAGGAIVLNQKSGLPELELQGDHRDALLEFFASLGYPAKASGG